MDIKQIIQAAAQDPQFQPALRAAQQELADVSPEQVDSLIELIELALENPERYAEIRQAAVQDGMVEPGDLPEQFNPMLLASVLVVLYKLREGGGGAQAAMARGGLTRMRSLAARGRLGDTMLAHISPEEAALLKARGGAGTLNPDTGLPQYFSLKKLFAVALPIALNFIAPGLGVAIGGAMGLTGTAAAMAGSAVIGGLSSGLTGGNVLQGAVLGGLGGGLGEVVGGAANEALGLGLGETGRSVLGGALVGGGMGAATGQGFGRGALMGAVGAGLGAATQGVGEGALGAGIGAGGQMAGRMLTAGYSPREALAGGALSGLATGLTYRPATTFGARPSESAVSEMRQMPGGMSKLSSEFLPGETALSPETGLPYQPAGAQPSAAAAQTPTQSNLFSLKNLGALAMLSGLSSAPPAAMEAVKKLSPQQQAYFTRPNVSWDWNRMQADANARNMSLADYMSSNWPSITGYASAAATPDARQGAYASAQPRGMATGGSPLMRLARGAGSGRADTIDARLSDGEYVMDAETVAMLGDGSTEEGARRLDGMRAQLRRHKGKALARGKFSPNAKSPLAYLRG